MSFTFLGSKPFFAVLLTIKNFLKMKMLILTGSPNSYSVKRIKEEAEKRGHEVSVHYPSDFICYVSDQKSGYDKIFLKDGKEDMQRVKAKDFDVVIPRVAGHSIFEFACVVTDHLNKNMGIPTTSDAIGLRIASNKFMTSQFLSQGKVRTIKSLFSQKPADFGFIATTLDGPPIVGKTQSGSMGEGVFILSDALGISTTLGAFAKSNINIVLQKFIDSGEPKTDLRVYVVDGKVSAAYQRFALDGEFRANYSINKKGLKVELTEEETQMAIDAAKAVGLGVAGVDILRNVKDNNKPYTIEVNGNASLSGISAVTGHNVALDIVLYAEKIGKKSKAPKTDEPEGKNPFQNRIDSLQWPEPAVKDGMTTKEAMTATKEKYGL